jgi:hypothetical protein
MNLVYWAIIAGTNRMKIFAYIITPTIKNFTAPEGIKSLHNTHST